MVLEKRVEWNPCPFSVCDLMDHVSPFQRLFLNTIL